MRILVVNVNTTESMTDGDRRAGPRGGRARHRDRRR